MLRDPVAMPRILFINLNPRPEWRRDKTLIYFNIGLCQVMTHVKRCGYAFDLLDFSVSPMRREEFVDRVARERYDVVAFGGMIHTLWQMEEIARLVKEVRRETCLVAGGYATMLDDEAALRWTQIDVAVKGEGEFAFVEVLERIREGRDFSGIPGVAWRGADGTIHAAATRKPDLPLDQKGIPEWDLFDVEAYIESGTRLKSHHLGAYREQRFFPIITTRGCPYRCTFCSNNPKIQSHNPYRRHSAPFVAGMIRELHERHRVNHFKFIDELSFLTAGDVETLLDELERLDLGVTFEAICRVGLFGPDDLPLARRMKKAGFQKLFYSLESGSPRILKLMKKQISPDEFAVQKRILDQAGIASGTNVIVGYPTETEEEIARTFDVCLESSVMPSVCFLLPIPGSDMYDLALERGLIADEREYVMNIGEQQYLKVNMTDLPDDRLYQVTIAHLKRLRDAMGLDIPDANLICSVNIDGTGTGAKTLFLR